MVATGMKAAYERPSEGGRARRMLDAGSKKVGFRISRGELGKRSGGAGLDGSGVAGSGVEGFGVEVGHSEKAREEGGGWEGSPRREVEARGRMAVRSGYEALIHRTDSSELSSG